MSHTHAMRVAIISWIINLNFQDRYRSHKENHHVCAMWWDGMESKIECKMV